MSPPPTATFRVWLINPRRVRWGWAALLLLPLYVLSTVGFTQLNQPLLGVLLSTALVLGTAYWFGRWILIAATVSVGPAQLVLAPAETGSGSETLLFSQLAYCTYTTYRTRLLQVFRNDGTRLQLRARQGVADLDALAELLQSRLNASRSRLPHARL